MQNPSRTRRALVAIAIGGGAAVLVLAFAHTGVARPDLDQVLFAARELRAGHDPYPLVGPHRAFDWGWPLLYPLTAAILVLPLTALPVVAARMLFFGSSVALYTYAITREGYTRLPIVVSGAMFYAAYAVQWSPLLAAAFLIPPLGILFAAKPNIGLALFLARPSWWAFGGVLAITVASLLVQPSWLPEWLAAARAAVHVRPPITQLGGPLLALAALRWRRPEARLLLALACVPQNLLVYESFALALIPATVGEAAAFAALTHVALWSLLAMAPYDAPASYLATSARMMIALLYLPCLLMVLRRPNEGTVPAWLDRWRRGARPGDCRGRMWSLRREYDPGGEARGVGRRRPEDSLARGVGGRRRSDEEAGTH